VENRPKTETHNLTDRCLEIYIYYSLLLLLQALPVNPQVRTLPLVKRIQGNFRTGPARLRPWQLLALSTLAAVATAAGLSSKLGGHSSSDVRYLDIQVDDMCAPHLAGPPVSGTTSQWGMSGDPCPS
jgi:hypothetical protein